MSLVCLAQNANAQSVLSPAAIAELNQNIKQHRMGTLVIEARPGTVVRVEQVRHEFWFGAALSSGALTGRLSPENRRQYEAAFLTNFNAGVLENAFKWASMEPRQGQVNYAEVDAILGWADQHEIPLRGHCIFWGITNFVSGWVKQLSDDELRQALQTRATTMASRYRGRFAEYDLNNEMLHGNYFAARLGPGITKQMAAWVKAADPQAKLFFNDYNVLTGRRTDDYLKHIRDLVEQGAAFDGIGVQGHSHAEAFDPAALRQALDKLARTGLPVRVTEFNLPGQNSRYYRQRDLKLTAEEEQAKAQALTDYYRICFAHPAVTGILMWGFWEGANWIPQSSLYSRDWKPLPAALAYQDLLFREWWTRWEGKADATGRCKVPAYFGEHKVTVAEQEKTVVLGKSNAKAVVPFK